MSNSDLEILVHYVCSSTTLGCNMEMLKWNQWCLSSQIPYASIKSQHQPLWTDSCKISWIKNYYSCLLSVYKLVGKRHNCFWVNHCVTWEYVTGTFRYSTRLLCWALLCFPLTWKEDSKEQFFFLSLSFLSKKFHLSTKENTFLVIK